MELQEILVALFGLGGGGILGWLAKDIRFKTRSEYLDKTHKQSIETLMEANKLQKQANRMTRDSVVSIKQNQQLMAERQMNHLKGFEEYKKLQHQENEKINVTLMENTKAISGLNATMQGLDSVLKLIFKQQNGN